MPSSQLRSRRVLGVRTQDAVHWVGDGFAVRTLLSYDETPELFSPFLLLDYAAPQEFPSTSERRGVGQHPHRGFETVTIAFQGEVEHRDSAGNSGRIGPGDVQWMTAASGVLHEEFHGRGFAKSGGQFEMAQIWVNLPARFKMSPPRYQDILASRIPAAPLANGAGELRVIAGEALGAAGPAKTFTPVELFVLRLRAGAEADVPVPAGHTALALVMRGPVRFGGGESVPERALAILDREGDAVRVRADDARDAMVLVLGGEPIDEPVVGYGPFVMNTEAEIEQAIRDTRAGRMGRLD